MAASALVAARAGAAEIVIKNHGGETMRVSFRCRTRGGWADMAANGAKAVVLPDRRQIPVRPHGGCFRVVAVNDHNVLFTSGWETMSDDRTNTFAISAPATRRRRRPGRPPRAQKSVGPIDLKYKDILNKIGDLGRSDFSLT